MKFRIAKSELLPKLAQLAKVTDGKIVPILEDVLLMAYDGSLTMTAGDGVISMSCTIDDVTITKTGAATIPAKKLYDIAKKMGDTIEIETQGTFGTKVTSVKSKYELAGQDPIIYPTQANVMGEQVKISGSSFKDMIKRTAYAVSTNESSQNILVGLKIRVKASRMTATGCDRHRLSEVSHELKSGFTDVVAIVKGIAFRDFIGIIPDSEITITFSESNFHIKTAEYDIYLRVLDGTYPVTDNIAPNTFTTEINVNVKEFKEALERALVVALDDKTNVLRMHVGSLEEISITANTETDKAFEAVEARVKGNLLKVVGFNGKYLIEALGTITAERVTLMMQDAMKPIVIKTDGTDDFQIVLPYRVTQ